MTKRAWFVLLALFGPAPLGAQSLMYRPANLGGTWVPDPAVVQFNFVHRFYVAPSGGSNKVTNFPTFTLAVGLSHGLALGTHYGSNSLVVNLPGVYRPNETELFARWRVLGAEGKPGFTLALTPAYNAAARSADGEVSLDYTVSRLTLTGVARGVSKAFGQDTARAAFGGGAVFRLSDYVAVSTDAGAFASGRVPAAWSVAIDFVIPGSPHTFSLQASNATTSTIQGNSVGSSKMLYGFEFTIPLHLKRFAPWFHRTANAPPPPAAVAGVAADVRMQAYKFGTDSLTITAGQAVRWINDDPVEHTVTFDGAEVGSPPLPRNGTFIHRFDKPGRYTYHCTPHPFMKGVVIVR